jgi:hypothetical protein
MNGTAIRRRPAPRQFLHQHAARAQGCDMLAGTRFGIELITDVGRRAKLIGSGLLP